jgi:predicted patatin/cPLA2 family phospholipase
MEVFLLSLKTESICVNLLLINMKDIGLVLEGGGLRGIYTAGVLDTFLKHQLIFSYVIGVSAGTAYGASYVSKQIGRNREVNLRFTSDPRYLSFYNLLKTGNIFDSNFVYHEIPSKLIPFDFDAFYQSGIRFQIGVTDCATGKIEFRDGNKLSPGELMDTLAASSSLPFVSKMATLQKKRYLDGGIADSIPIYQAFTDGNARAVVVLTRNKGYRKKPVRYQWVVKIFYRRYPNLVNAILCRPSIYNQTLDELEKMQEEGKIFIIRPQQTITVSRIEKNTQKLMDLYETACIETEQILPALKNWLESPIGNAGIKEPETLTSNQ